MDGERPIHVLLADDQEPFRRAARAVVAVTPGFTLVAEAASGEEAIELAAMLKPDVVLLDVRMPGMGGVEAARRIAAPLTVLISTYPAADVAGAAGAGFLRKEDFGPAALRALWRERASARAPTDTAAPP
jgi:DNA-binding NarL/FixJ family response regulator